jgi:hypothetical protein
MPPEPPPPLDSRGTNRRSVDAASRGSSAAPATAGAGTELLQLAQNDYERQSLIGAKGPTQQRIVEYLVRERQHMLVRARERDRELRERHYFDTPEDARRAKREAEAELAELERTESILNSFVPLLERWRSLRRADAITTARMADFDLETDVGNRALMDVAVSGGAVSFLAETVAELSLSAVIGPAPKGKRVVEAPLKGTPLPDVAFAPKALAKRRVPIEPKGVKQTIGKPKSKSAMVDGERLTQEKRGLLNNGVDPPALPPTGLTHDVLQSLGDVKTTNEFMLRMRKLVPGLSGPMKIGDLFEHAEHVKTLFSREFRSTDAGRRYDYIDGTIGGPQDLIASLACHASFARVPAVLPSEILKKLLKPLGRVDDAQWLAFWRIGKKQQGVLERLVSAGKIKFGVPFASKNLDELVIEYTRRLRTVWPRDEVHGGMRDLFLKSLKEELASGEGAILSHIQDVLPDPVKRALGTGNEIYRFFEKYILLEPPNYQLMYEIATKLGDKAAQNAKRK